MLKVIENVGNSKFIAIVTDAETAMQLAKRKVMNKYPHIMAIRCIAHHINLITKDIISIDWAKEILQKCQKVISFFHGTHRAGDALRNKIRKFFSKGSLKSSVKTCWSTTWDIFSEQPDIFINATKTKAIIQDRQFWYNVKQLKLILKPVKSALEFNTTTLADCFFELLKMARAISEIPSF
ncbi:hypothetical protein RirG_238450 [Rhizophagus irregularis DAOM 197198w]|uniref:DUF659 domain-containing protein n=1 Tax=Rhizophagus irregularis (strain DAOM 197198w) TaxID=1432141 RepID=A0A015I9Y9_RHIIW|nr:hypothetical protein RirG_238450 [Rhizophagus irregularis DAOM 197198w]